MKMVHFILQGKGGVGKSLVASILAQYLQSSNAAETVHCFDTDPVNQTFSRYKALNAEMVPILNQDDLIDSRKFDGLIEQLIEKDGIAVIDNGAATFVPIIGYLKENQIVDLLESMGIKVMIHVVVTGGQAMKDTFYGLGTVLEKLSAPVTVWSNEFFGEINENGKTLTEFKVLTENKKRITGVVSLVRRNADTYGKDIELMVKEYLTFAEVHTSGKFSLMPRQRLLNTQRDIFARLDALPTLSPGA